MKRFMDLGYADIDTMVIGNTPPNYPDANATTDDQPILYIGDQSDTDDHEGFFDLGFMPQAVVSVVPLNVVFPDSYFEGEIP
ncbi:unnamed protein product [Lactuca saligna]|uniref:Uncharacterized protein n=1 Tax=Lactuca saligna TaxID=75948 RepID=A0AA35VFY5_LACSI|nr:unnamed protein product [Lactuca saligna]